MRRVLGGGLAFGCGVIGWLTLAGPGAAQEPGDVLHAKLRPEEAEPGEDITVWSSEPCASPEGIIGERIDWQIWLADDDDDAKLIDQGSAELAEDGNWEFHFVAPLEHTAYNLLVTCILPPTTTPDSRQYEALPFWVDADGDTDMTTVVPRPPTGPVTGPGPITPTTLLSEPEVPAPTPARAVVTEPNFAG